MRTVLALDQGTTGSTALLLDENGTVLGRGYREITQHYPAPGWVEHDAEEIFALTLAAARDALRGSDGAPDALGITNQRETVVCWNRVSGKPLGRAIVWQDRRTSERCASLAGKSEWSYARTWLMLDPYFSATKLELLLKDEKVARAHASGELLVGTIDSWLIWKLTAGKVHATDPTNASRTMLFDIGTMRWSPELCALFSVPMSVLPDVRPSSGDFGVTESSIFGSAIPITGVAGDQQAALFGQGCWDRGQSKNTYGTGAFLLMNVGSERPAARNDGGLLATVACDAFGKPVYALEAAIFIAGAAVQWLRDGLGLIASASETEAIARSVESTDGVYFVPALVGMGAPHWEANARGTIVGLTRGTRREHLVRATLEAMAFGTADVFGSMCAQSGADIQCLRVDGGACANDWLIQFQSDLLGVPVERPQMIETTASGAAGLAGLTVGVWKTAEDFLATRHFRRFEPGMRRDRTGLDGWHRAVRAALSWARDTA
jgi:glycerol kinase